MKMALKLVIYDRVDFVCSSFILSIASSLRVVSFEIWMSLSQNYSLRLTSVFLDEELSS